MSENIKILIAFIGGVIACRLFLKIASILIFKRQTQVMRKKIIKIGQTQGLVLNSCPFCGGDHANIVKDITEDGTVVYKMFCDPDEGGCGGSTQWVTNTVDAICLWNARPKDYKKFEENNYGQEES